MATGTFFQVVELPLPWPLSQRQIIFSAPTESGLTQIYSDQSGSLEFVIIENETLVTSYRTQAIRVSGSGLVLITAKWDGENVELSLNRDTLLPENACEGTILEVKPTKHLAESQSSFDRPDALRCCAFWMEWRRQRYAEEKDEATKKGRSKTLAEQFFELDKAQRTLIDLTYSIRSGNHHLLGSLASELRALLFWAPKNKNYNPLLLRLAGVLNLPLPIYKLPEPEKSPHFSEVEKILETGTFGFIFKEPSLFKSFPNHELVDLQDWLNSLIVTPSILKQKYAEESKEELTAKWFIMEAANTLGATHYDDYVKEPMYLLKEMKTQEQSQIMPFLLKVAEITVYLAGYVLLHARQRGLYQRKTW